MNTESLCLGCMNDKGGETVCPICGFSPENNNPDNCMPLGMLLRDRYIIGKVCKSDGEGITYIGWDKAAENRVEIREYFPIGFAHRNPDKTVSMESDGKYVFNECLLEFLEINRAVAEAGFPANVRVLDVFEENGTAYSVKEYVSGITLAQFLEKNGGTLKWEQARPLFLPVIDTLAGMNEKGFVHAGISTETVLVGRDGKLRITGYSVKKLRYCDSELVDTVYKGYAACEQYGLGDMTIGAYTDVYGLSAVLFRVFIGTVPPEATKRLENDGMTVPAKIAEELPRQVLTALANGLKLSPVKRTATVEIFKNELIYGEIAEVKVPGERADTHRKPENITSKSSSNSAKYVLISAICTVAVFGIIVAVLCATVFKDKLFGQNNVSSGGFVSVEAPKVDSIGDVESGVEPEQKLFSVPDLAKKYYSEILKDEQYEMFEFSIKDKQFSDDCPKGTVCSQSVKTGTQVTRGTKIELIISLGPKEIKIANLKGLDEDGAKLELLKQGFLYENIKVLEKYDEDGEPGKVIEQSPSYGEKVSTDVMVEIYVNSYVEEENTSSDTDNETESQPSDETENDN